MHTHAYKPPSKCSMCHRDECVIQQIMSRWAAAGCKLQKEMGNHKVIVIGGEGGLLLVLPHQSPPHNNVFGARACYARCKTPDIHATAHSKVSLTSKTASVFNRQLQIVSTATSSLLRNQQKPQRQTCLWFGDVVISSSREKTSVRSKSHILLALSA